MKKYFFEVKPDEQKKLIEKYPDAVFSEEPLSLATVRDAHDAEIICVMVHSHCSEEVLAELPRLRLIVTRSAGYNHIDLGYCSRMEIEVCRVPDYGSHVIAEHVFALLLAAARRVLEGEDKTNQGLFDETGLKGMALKGKTLGVIGVGHIGAQVCRIASRGFLMKVLAFDTHPNEELAIEYGFQYVQSVDEIYQHSDIISLHAPLLPQTKHMINEESINKMKDGVVLINTARGGLIKSEDLIAAVRRGKFAHVGLDVIEHEEELEASQELLRLPGVIITPHLAYYTQESIDAMYNVSFESIDAFERGDDLKYQVLAS